MKAKALLGMGLAAALSGGLSFGGGYGGGHVGGHYRRPKPPQHPTNKRKQIKLRRKQRHRQ